MLAGGEEAVVSGGGGAGAGAEAAEFVGVFDRFGLVDFFVFFFGAFTVVVGLRVVFATSFSTG